MLDIGCGKGELLTIIAKKFSASECIGIEIEDDLYEAKVKTTRAGLGNVQFVRADCSLLPFRSRSVQLVFCASVLEHLLNALPAVLELDRIVESDGKLVIGLPTENRAYQISRWIVGLRKPKDHYHRGTDLETLLASRFANPKSTTLPFSFLPRFLSLYIVLICGKRSEPRPPVNGDATELDIA